VHGKVTRNVREASITSEPASPMLATGETAI
jgi:hypothetical protein